MRIVLADNQQQRSEQLRRILLGEGLTCEAEDVVGYDGLLDRLAGVKADLVVVTCDGAREDALAAIRTAHQVSPAPILAVGEGATVELIREAMRAGAREFLDLSRVGDELAQALVKIEADGLVPSQRGRIIALYSPSGGVGVSTTAVNLAVRLAGSLPGQVGLIDLKPAPSDLALMLDLEPQYTLDDIAKAADRLDRKMLEGAMIRHRSGVRVLAQAGYPADGSLPPGTLTRDVVRKLCTLLRRACAVTVLDLASALDDVQIEAMKLSTLVGLIVRADVPGLRRARWAVDVAAGRGVGRDRFRLVLNRYGQSGQVDLAKVEEILGIRVFQQIPDDQRLVNKAVNRGVPLTEVSKTSRISRSFSSFAQSVQTSAGSPRE
jgi:pilus assembly protein CpaE